MRGGSPGRGPSTGVVVLVEQECVDLGLGGAGLAERVGEVGGPVEVGGHLVPSGFGMARHFSAWDCAHSPTLATHRRKSSSSIG